MCDLTSSQLDLGFSQLSQTDSLFAVTEIGTELGLSQFTLSQPTEEVVEVESKTPVASVKATTLSQVSFDNDPELSQFASLSQELSFSQPSEDEVNEEEKQTTIKQLRDIGGLLLVALKFDKRNFGPDALSIVTGFEFVWRALGQGLWVSINENKKQGTRFLFRRSRDDMCRLEWDRLVATTVAMAREKELNLHCRPTVGWVQLRYKAMLDVIYAMYHLVYLLYTVLFPFSQFDSSAVFWAVQRIIEGSKDECSCYNTILRMVRLWQFVNGSAVNMNLVRGIVYHEGVHGLLEKATINRKLEGIEDLTGSITQLHDVVYDRNGWHLIDSRQRGEFAVAVTAFAVSLCLVHPSTKEMLSTTAAAYQRNAKKRKRCK